MTDEVILPMVVTLTPSNCTVDGGKFKGYTAWGQLDWTKATFRTQASIMVVIAGANAPYDPHWAVPHINGETVHRVRLKGKPK